MKHFDFRIPYQAGILTLISFLPLFGFELLRNENKLSLSLAGLYSFTVIASTIVSIIFFYGFFALGNKERLEPLKLSSVLMMIFSVLSSIYTIGLIYNKVLESNPIIPGAILVIAGAVELFFSYSLFSLQENYSEAKGAANWGIILGISYMTYFLSFIGLLLLIPVYWKRVKLMHEAGED